MPPTNKKNWTDTELGHLIGISKQAVGVLIKEGKIDDTGTLQQALHSYISGLREVAAGRGTGDAQERLLEARAEDTEMAAKLKQLEYAKEVGILVLADDIEQSLIEFANRFQREFRNHMEKTFSQIESNYKIKIDAQEVKDAIEVFIERAADFSQNLLEAP